MRNIEPHDRRLDDYVLLGRLQGGLRSELWLAIERSRPELSAPVVIKSFFPHAPGAALEGLHHELALAARMDHPNVLWTRRVDLASERPFVVSDYLDGVTLHTLLRRASVAGARVGNAVVARVLWGIVQAVAHADSRATAVSERRLVQRRIAADDVFLTVDGGVQLLGFKSPLSVQNGSVPAGDHERPAAVDMLLGEHLTPELRAVLAQAMREDVRPCDRLSSFAEALHAWLRLQGDSDGRLELAATMQELLPTARHERQAWVDALRERALGAPLDAPEAEVGPVSGIRRMRSIHAVVGTAPDRPLDRSSVPDSSAPVAGQRSWTPRASAQLVGTHLGQRSRGSTFSAKSRMSRSNG